MTRAETSEAKLSNFCAQGNQGTLKHWDIMTGYMGHRTPTQSNSIGCHCAHANGDTDCCAPQLAQQLPHGEGAKAWSTSQPLHRRNTFVCMVGWSTFPWCQADGLESVSLPSLAVPASVPARLCVWHLKKQQLKILLADLLQQGQAPKQAQSQP